MSRLDLSVCEGSGSDEEKAGLIADAITKRAAGGSLPAFMAVPLSGWCASPTLIGKVASSLGPSFQVVRPDEFVALVAGPRLRLRLLDGSGGILPGCEVMITDPTGRTLRSETDGEGWTEFFVADGYYLVEAFWQGSRVNQTSILLQGATERTLDCGVFDLRVVVKDLLGLAVGDVKVEARSVREEVVGSAQTDGRGRVQFAQLPEGHYRIVVSSLWLKTHSLVSASDNGSRTITVAVSYAVVGVILVAATLASLSAWMLISRPWRRRGIARRWDLGTVPHGPRQDLNTQLGEVLGRIEARHATRDGRTLSQGPSRTLEDELSFVLDEIESRRRS
jgi:hypothetical protein